MTAPANRKAASDPQAAEQWQEAVDAAQGLLALEYARILGFITWGTEVNIPRCVEILERGAALGVIPRDDAVLQFVGEAAEGVDRERIYRVVRTALEMSGNPNLAEIVPFLAATEVRRAD